MAKLVTVATDGFRDYVSLPGGRQINLGSVSVLKLVTSLVRGVNPCRRALDAFLKNRQVIISVDLDELEDLLKPKRSRWAGLGDLFIPNGFRQLRGTSMNPETSQAEVINQKIAAIEEGITLLDKAAAEDTDGGETKGLLIASLSSMISELGVGPDVKTAAFDKDMMEELSLFMDNESSLYSQKISIIKNIMRKKKRGVYDNNLAPKLWLYWVDSGAESYVKQFNIKIPGKKYFPIDLRRALAEELAKDENRKIDEGEYSSIKVAGEDQDKGEDKKDDKKSLPPWLEDKKGASDAEQVAKEGGVDNPYKGKDQGENSTYYKLASSDVPIINEALAHSVMAKIDLALGVVDASTKKNVHLAKSDLNKITKNLSTLITGADLGDPTLCTPLKELALMADKVYSHFS